MTEIFCKESEKQINYCNYISSFPWLKHFNADQPLQYCFTYTLSNFPAALFWYFRMLLQNRNLALLFLSYDVYQNKADKKNYIFLHISGVFPSLGWKVLYLHVLFFWYFTFYSFFLLTKDEIGLKATAYQNRPSGKFFQSVLIL